MNRFLFNLFLACIFTGSAFSQQAPHRFKAGDKLPDIVLADAFGDSVNTAKLKGKKILITFNRYVSCPLCNFRTHELLEHYDTLKMNGLVIISIYESGKETLTEYTTKEQVPFYMIPDPQQLLYKKFKVQKSWWKSFIGLFNHYRQKHNKGRKLFKSQYKRDGHLNRIGADFLIDENGNVRTAYYGKFVGDHFPVEDILKWVLEK